MGKALIISLGGTPEAIISSIREHTPEFVCFYVSQQTNHLIGDVLAHFRDNAVPFKTHTILVDDPEDLIHCYEKAVRTADMAIQQGYKPDEVTVDYTGGTKVMTAALSIATIGKGFKFSYVGGTFRNKGGVGVVKTGSEQVRTIFDPWQLFAVEERKQLAMYFNAHQYEAAYEMAKKLSSKVLQPFDSLFNALSMAIEGYRQWDTFKHELAVEKLEQAKRKLEGALPYLKPPYDIVKGFFEVLKQNTGFLKQMKSNSMDYNKMTNEFVVDLLSNAERRAEEGKYDDAIARLYRSLEMIGQIAFESAFGVQTNEVPEEKIPEKFRQSYKMKYTNKKTGKLKLGLAKAFEVLNEVNNSVGVGYTNKKMELKKILTARNNSILAHGIAPVKKKTFNDFNEILRATFSLTDRIEFPKLHW